MAELGEDLRFTDRPDEAFYIHSLVKPGAKLTVEAPIPIRSGDKVTVLGHGRPLTWTLSQRGAGGRRPRSRTQGGAARMGLQRALAS
ncbi:hypothetical protein [Streptomyces sp. NPDC059943]|uniref:hypothetical protein n=1 Tax=Streptomyces sp. NPDC059943 TaxID=3347010 RepID=UPI00365A84BC